MQTDGEIETKTRVYIAESPHKLDRCDLETTNVDLFVCGLMNQQPQFGSFNRTPSDMDMIWIHRFPDGSYSPKMTFGTFGTLLFSIAKKVRVVFAVDV